LSRSRRHAWSKTIVFSFPFARPSVELIEPVVERHAPHVSGRERQDVNVTAPVRVETMPSCFLSGE
jgi:hypothetical protein